MSDLALVVTRRLLRKLMQAALADPDIVIDGEAWDKIYTYMSAEHDPNISHQGGVALYSVIKLINGEYRRLNNNA
jgi:hypothetical protein